ILDREFDNAIQSVWPQCGQCWCDIQILRILMPGSKRKCTKERLEYAINSCQSWTAALLLALLFAVQSMVSNAEPPSPTIGVAASITPSAEAGRGTVFQKLAPGSELHASETVRTGGAGKADLVFVDRTNLTVGPTSEVVLDQFVYDPVGSSGKVVLQTTRGDFRFVSGTQDSSAYQVKTPYGTLSVRGH